MPVGDGASSEVQAAFQYAGASVDPRTITEVLGMQPTRAHLKGEVVEHRATRTYPSGLWAVQSSVDCHRPLEEHLTDLLDKLEPRAAGIRQMLRGGLAPTFFCGLFMLVDDTDGFVRLDALVLSRISALGAALELHVYWSGEEGAGRGHVGQGD